MSLNITHHLKGMTYFLIVNVLVNHIQITLSLLLREKKTKNYVYNMNDHYDNPLSLHEYNYITKHINHSHGMSKCLCLDSNSLFHVMKRIVVFHR